VQHKGYHSFSHGAGGGPDSAWQRSRQQQAAGVDAACCTGDDHAASLLFFFKQKQTSYVFGKGSTIKALKTERDQLRSEAPPVVPSFAQA